MQVELDPAVGGVLPESPGHPRQGGEDRAVDGGETLQRLGLATGRNGAAWTASSWTIGRRDSASKTCAASESEPREERSMPSLCRVLSQPVACCKARRLSRAGLQKYIRSRATY